MQTTTTVQTGSIPTKTGRRGALSPLVIGLGVLLVVQLVLALGLDLGGRDMAPAGSQGPLLTFDPKKVTGIRVQAALGAPVLVKKTETGWIIPSLVDLPAAESKVTGLLTKLEGLQKRLPVATSEEALQRFKVADQDFERKLTLERGNEPPVTLYLGDSPGFRRLFVRAAGDNAVYDEELGLFDVPDKADSWSDRTLLHLKEEDIQKLTIAGLTLEPKDKGWQLADLAEGEGQDEQAVADKVRTVANIDFMGVIEKGKAPEIDKKAAPVEIAATMKNGEIIRYQIAKLAKGNDYLLTASNRPQGFTLSAYLGEDLTGINRTDLLKKPEESEQAPPQEPTPSSPAESGNAEPASGTTTKAPAEAKDATESGTQDTGTSKTPAATPEPKAPDGSISSE